MRTLKPFSLTVLNAPFQHNGKTRLLLIVGVMVDFTGSAVEQEQALWKLLAEAPGSSGMLDEFRPKVRGEVLLSGHAYAPGGKPAQVVAPRVALGAVDKTIWVVGDREWKATGPTDAVPFEKMPITWARAFGGAGYAPNPNGRGFAPVKSEAGDSVHPLPNVELAKQLVTSPRERPQPAGFGPIEPAWPQRLKKTGTYDKRWLETRYPEMAEDLDPTCFNLAPEDQWIDGFWQGGEPFVLENLHPQRQRLEGSLPAFRARCFVTRKGAADGALEDVSLRCDTVWFLPEHERVILLYRGGVDVVDEEASDLVDVLAALERPGEPRPIEHYRAVRAKRLDKDMGPVHTLRDSDLMPPGLRTVKASATSEIEKLLQREGLLEKNSRRLAERRLEEQRAQLRAAGLDPDAYTPKEVPPEPTMPDFDQLADVIQDSRQQAADLARQGEQQRNAAIERVRELAREAGIDFDDKIAEAQGMAGGPPKFRAMEELARIKGLLERARALGAPMPPEAAIIDDPRTLERFKLTEAGMREAYRRSVHYAPPAAVLDATASARLRAEVETALARKESLAERDLTGADLSGLDFSGTDLSGAFLEKTNLAGCLFRGADLTQAVLARANLEGADLHGARTRGANFGGAKLTGAKLTGEVDLTDAVFLRATLDGADFTGACLDTVLLSEAHCDGTCFARVTGKRFTVVKGDLSRADLREAKLSECNFLETVLTGTDFSGATLFRTAFLDVAANGICFRGANLDKMRVVRVETGSTFEGCDMRNATLKMGNLRGVAMAGADLRGADLTGADFSGCDLRGAKITDARAAGVRFVKADLTDADLSRSDLMNALLAGAIVRGACFEEASVFRADGARMKGDDRTSFKGANVTQIRLVPDRSANG